MKKIVWMLMTALSLCACVSGQPQTELSEDGMSSEYVTSEQTSSTCVSSGCTSSECASSECASSAQESSEESVLSEDSSASEDESSYEEPAPTVILDPGHGFGDVGCTFPDTGVYEKEITLILAHKIGEALQSRGINVLYTHDGKSFLTGKELDELASEAGIDYTAYLRRLITECGGMSSDQAEETLQACLDGINRNDIFGGHERCCYANLLDAEQEIALFLSVHINSNLDSDELKGFEMYYCSDMPYASESLSALQSMQGVLADRFADRYVRALSYAWEDGNIVNKYTDMPSVLIESGYVTTPSEAADLQNEAWQNEFAQAVADGILQYLTIE